MGYSPDAINVLLNLRTLGLYGIWNIRSRNNMASEEMFETMKNEMFRPRALWVIMQGVPQSFITTQMRSIPKEWATVFMQTLEITSNSLEFTIKRAFGLMAILNHERVNFGHLIMIKYKTPRWCTTTCLWIFLYNWEIIQVNKCPKSSI